MLHQAPVLILQMMQPAGAYCADQEFMNMFGAVDKELSTFNFKLARLLFPVSARPLMASGQHTSDHSCADSWISCKNFLNCAA